MNGGQAHGYSGKSLGAKMGLRPGLALWAVGAPTAYAELLGPESATVMISRDGKAGPFGMAHLFVRDRAELTDKAQAALDKLTPGGALWVSWPKRSSALFKDLTEDGVREVVLPTGWVDVKVCAVDADWSGLKFLKRKA
jgi:hypothetical protein